MVASLNSGRNVLTINTPPPPPLSVSSVINRLVYTALINIIKVKISMW